MTKTFAKLNVKDQGEILVVDAPASFEGELAALSGVAIRRRPSDAKAFAFSIFFVTTARQVAAAAKAAGSKAPGDAVVWLAYPKGTSKKYRCEFNRDNGFAPLGEAGFEPVRMVAIDEDWSALRFRRVEFIATLTRDARMALTDEGRRRASSSRRVPRAKARGKVRA